MTWDKKKWEWELHSISQLTHELLALFPKGAVIGLSGELGSGKTTLVRSVIQAIAEKQKIHLDRVVSPSFVLHQSYPKLNPPVHHFDLYRLNQVTEPMLIELGFYDSVEEALSKQGYVFIEWPEMCGDEKILKLTAKISIEIRETSRVYLFENKV